MACRLLFDDFDDTFAPAAFGMRARDSLRLRPRVLAWGAAGGL